MALAVSLLSPALAWARNVRPVDEGRRNPSFARFRARLLRACKERDARFIEQTVSPDIQVDFGGGAGRAYFKKTWRLPRRDSRFYLELGQVLRLGGTWQRDPESGRTDFAAPYTFVAFPDDLDAFTHLCAIVPHAAIRREPRTGAPVIATARYDILQTTGAPRTANPRWWHVRAPGGKSGWIEARLVRSPIAYRAFFERKRGRWMMTAFVAGD